MTDERPVLLRTEITAARERVRHHLCALSGRTTTDAQRRAFDAAIIDLSGGDVPVRGPNHAHELLGALEHRRYIGRDLTVDELAALAYAIGLLRLLGDDCIWRTRPQEDAGAA